MGRPRDQQAPQQAPPQGPSETQIAAAIAAILGGAVVVASVEGAVAFMLGPILAPFALPSATAGEIATGSARLVSEDVPEAPGEAATPQEPLGRAHIQNLLRRGQYAIAAAKRVARRVGQGSSVPDAFAAEKSFFDKHRASEADRLFSAREAQGALERYGRTATWVHGDPKEPRPTHLAADGGQFDILAPPASVGRVLPGVLPGCTCTIGAPRPGARRLT